MVSLPIRQDLSAAELRDLARKESDARVSRRLLGLAMALDGVSRGEAARQAGMDRQALRDWVVRYNAGGVNGLRDRGRSGRPALLTPELEEELQSPSHIERHGGTCGGGGGDGPLQIDGCPGRSRRLNDVLGGGGGKDAVLPLSAFRSGDLPEHRSR